MSGIGSILTAVRGGGRPFANRAYIIPLDVYQSDARQENDRFYLQYFPETITDSKQTNWQTKEVPGLSHPIYQWISGGAREISFTSIFTRDRELTDQEKSYLRSGGNSMQGASVPVDPQSVEKGFSDPRNVDIPSAIAWLRSFLYPNYSVAYDAPQGVQLYGVQIFNGPGARPKPPTKLILGLPGMRLGQGSSATDQDEIVCIMLSADVSYESFFSDGTPRIAKVTMSFAEIMQVENKVSVADASVLRSRGRSGYRIKVSNQDKKTK